jgi:hypothetical protein
MVKKILTIEKVADNHLSIHIKLSSLHRKLMDQTRKKTAAKNSKELTDTMVRSDILAIPVNMIVDSTSKCVPISYKISIAKF